MMRSEGRKLRTMRAEDGRQVRPDAVRRYGMTHAVRIHAPAVRALVRCA